MLNLNLLSQIDTHSLRFLPFTIYNVRYIQMFQLTSTYVVHINSYNSVAFTNENCNLTKIIIVIIKSTLNPMYLHIYHHCKVVYQNCTVLEENLEKIM